MCRDSVGLSLGRMSVFLVKCSTGVLPGAVVSGSVPPIGSRRFCPRRVYVPRACAGGSAAVLLQLSWYGHVVLIVFLFT